MSGSKIDPLNSVKSFQNFIWLSSTLSVEFNELINVSLFWFSGVPVFGEHQSHLIGKFLKFEIFLKKCITFSSRRLRTAPIQRNQENYSIRRMSFCLKNLIRYFERYQQITELYPFFELEAEPQFCRNQA